MEKIRQGLGLSAVAAAISYAALWLAYAQFYFRVGITPEDVGIDKADLLSQALVGPAILFAALVLTYGLALIVIVVATILNVRHIVKSIPELIDILRGRDASDAPLPQPSLPERAFLARAKLRSFLKKERRSARWASSAVAALTLAVICAELYGQAIALGHDVVRGKPVERPYFTIGGVAIPLLHVRATAAGVTWTGGDSVPPLLESAGSETECLLYLGESSGTTLVFSPPSGTLHRLPTPDVAIELRPAGTYDQDCGGSNT